MRKPTLALNPRLGNAVSVEPDRTLLADPVLGSLRTVYDRYFSDVFGFEESHHFHFDGIVEGLPERDVSMHLHEVQKAAREVMSRMVLTPPERNPTAVR